MQYFQEVPVAYKQQEKIVQRNPGYVKPGNRSLSIIMMPVCYAYRPVAGGWNTGNERSTGMPISNAAGE